MAQEIQLTKRLLKVEHVIGEDTVQAIIRGEVTFPVAARKIWQTQTEARDVETSIVDDKIIVEGVLHKQIYWVAGVTAVVDGIQYIEGEVFETTVEEKFTHYVEVGGAREGMEVLVTARVEYVDYNKIDEAGTRWQQIIVLEIFVKVTEAVQLEVIIDVKAPPEYEIEVTKEMLKVQSVVGEARSQASLVNDIALPPQRDVRKVKEVIARIRDVETEIVPGKVIVSGTLHKQIIYVEEGTGRVFEFGVDERFNVFVEIPGAEPRMNVQVFPRIEYVDYELRPKPPGQSDLVRQTAILNVFVKVTEDVQLEVVTKIRGKNISVTKELLRAEVVVGEGQKQEVVRNDVLFPRPVEKIVDTINRVDINRRETKVLPGKVVIEGVIHKQIFYVGLCDDAVYEQPVDEDFTTFVEVPGAAPKMSLQVRGRVEHVNYDGPTYPENICTVTPFVPENYPWRQTAVVMVFVKVTKSQQLEVVTNVRPEAVVPPAPPPEPPTIRYYVIQQGDTLWKIAQKYGTTVEAIQRLNPGIDPQNLQIGQKIRLPAPDPR